MGLSLPSLTRVALISAISHFRFSIRFNLSKRFHFFKFFFFVNSLFNYNCIPKHFWFDLNQQVLSLF